MCYEEKYKQALGKAKEIIKYYKEHNRDEAAIEDLQEIFPELKESEGEKIRKALIKFHKSTIDIDGIKGYEILAWLEKQCEIENINNDDLATLEIWEDIIKENKEKWQLSDWFIESSSLLIQKVKYIENNHKSKFNIDNWSEEDDKRFNEILSVIDNAGILTESEYSFLCNIRPQN